MSFKATVSAGWTYTTGDTATAANLNALGIPDVTIPDNQTYLANVGLIATPGIAFNGDANTGLAQLSGADTISIVAGGASPVVFSGDQSAFSNTGVAGKPAITFNGDADTGISHITTDAVDIVCGGVVIGVFSSSGMAVVGNIEADSMTVNGLSVKTSGLDIATVSFATDFLGASTAWGTTSTVVATGAVATVAVGNGTFDTSSRGFVSQTVSAVSDRAVVTVPFSVLPTSGIARIRIQAATLSTGAQRYEVLAGLFSVVTASSSTGSGAWFQYTDSASAQFQTVTYNGTTRETQTTAITYTPGTDYTLEIRHTAASTFAFYINGVLATTHSTVTFATTTGNFAHAGVIIEKLVGAGSSVVYTDSIECQGPLVRV